MQLAFTANAPGQLFVCAKSPVAVIFAILRVDVPVFVTETPCGALAVPTSCPEKLKLEGARLVAGPTPVPLRETL